MAVLWSNPNPGGVYASQSNFRVEPAQISGLVSVIMQARARNAAADAAQNRALMQGIAQGITGAYNNCASKACRRTSATRRRIEGAAKAHRRLGSGPANDIINVQAEDPLPPNQDET